MLKLWFTSRIQRLRRQPYSVGFFLVLFILAAISITQFIVNSTYEKAIDRSYSYETLQANNQVVIHIMRTDPKHIQLQSISGGI